jgi:hypothetical protein
MPWWAYRSAAAASVGSSAIRCIVETDHVGTGLLGSNMPTTMGRQVSTISGYLTGFRRGIPAFAQVNRYL